MKHIQFENERKLEAKLREYLDDFFRHNRAGQVMRSLLEDAGIGLLPVIDHLTFRTLHVDKRAQEFLALGYVESERLEYGNWWAKVYRKHGYPPLFIDQAHEGAKGKDSIIPAWVHKFTDHTLHHVAVRVENLDHAIATLKKHGIECAGQIVGKHGGPLRQIFTLPEMKQGEPFSVLELAERRYGFAGFSAPQAEGLMQSTVEIKKAA